jgi:FAD/FMN-containing dehydrogenase
MACATVEANPAQLHNWNHSVVTTPAVLVRAKSVADVQAAVRGDGAGRFPSPVLAVGSAHTVTGALRNDGGTVVDVSALDSIVGLDEVAGKEVVRVQCGVKLAALHLWLDARVSLRLLCASLASASRFFFRVSLAHPPPPRAKQHQHQ